jgi:hypothetical protein
LGMADLDMRLFPCSPLGYLWTWGPARVEDFAHPVALGVKDNHAVFFYFTPNAWVPVVDPPVERVILAAYAEAMRERASESEQFRKRAEKAEADRDHLKRREESIIEVCERVADGGKYRADIVSAIQRIRQARDAAQKVAEVVVPENTRLREALAEAADWLDGATAIIEDEDICDEDDGEVPEARAKANAFRRLAGVPEVEWPEAKKSDEPECPGEDCLMCNGQACNKCGAGCWNNALTKKCEHDVMERHEAPPEANRG